MNLNNAHLGIQTRIILLFDLQPPQTRYPDAKGDRSLSCRWKKSSRLLPGVDTVTLTEVPLISH